MWEERFAKEGYLFGTEPVPFLLKHDTHFQKGQSVLSIAEGEGRNGVHLAKKGLNVTGVEFAPSAVSKATKLAALSGVEWMLLLFNQTCLNGTGPKTFLISLSVYFFSLSGQMSVTCSGARCWMQRAPVG